MHPIVAANSNVSNLLNVSEKENTLISLRYLDNPVELVRVETRMGRSLILSPESFFGLKKYDGKVIIDLTADEAPIPSVFRNFAPLPKGSDRISRWDFKVWYIAGLVLSCGAFIGQESRPAMIRLPVSRKIELERIEAFIISYARERRWVNANGTPWGTTLKVTGPYAQLSSRIIDKILIDDCDLAIPPGCLKIYRSRMGGAQPGTWQGLLAGILSGSHETPDGRVFVTRSAEVARMVHDTLFFSYGVPSTLHINPYEPPERMHVRRVQNPPSVFINNKHYANVQAAGLAHWDIDFLTNGTGPFLTSYQDEIAKIEPIGLGAALEIIAHGAGPINGFMFDLSFSVEQLAVEIASMEELFVDVSDPEAVIAKSHPHTTHKHGVI